MSASRAEPSALARNSPCSKVSSEPDAAAWRISRTPPGQAPPVVQLLPFIVSVAISFVSYQRKALTELHQRERGGFIVRPEDSPLAAPALIHYHTRKAMKRRTLVIIIVAVALLWLVDVCAASLLLHGYS